MIGEIVGWKFNHAEGIETRGEEITAWPFGDFPTAEEIQTWTDEYTYYLTKKNIQDEIDTLESLQFMIRGEREAWLALTVATAAGQGVSEPLLYSKNPFYKKLKDQDSAIKLLRAQL